FKNLPEPKNADNNDLEYSDSLKMDFTKPDINPEDEIEVENLSVCILEIGTD
ncbi:22940_t:CDS:2, partial [Rhizophagus irregularis]